MRWRGGAQCHGRQIKQKSSYHFSLSFPLILTLYTKEISVEAEGDKQSVMKETTGRLIEVR